MHVASLIPEPFLWLGAILVVGVILAGIVIYIRDLSNGESEPEEEKQKYQYLKKQSFLTPAELDFYNALGQAVSHEYRIFAQVHLGSILDEKIKGQDWRAARAHINRKSVDFLLCDKEYLTPKLAIELDDKSHEREDRVERDTEVERILKAAELPLLRVPNQGNFNPTDIGALVRHAQSAK